MAVFLRSRGSEVAVDCLGFLEVSERPPISCCIGHQHRGPVHRQGFQNERGKRAEDAYTFPVHIFLLPFFLLRLRWLTLIHSLNGIRLPLLLQQGSVQLYTPHATLLDSSVRKQFGCKTTPHR